MGRGQLFGHGLMVLPGYSGMNSVLDGWVRRAGRAFFKNKNVKGNTLQFHWFNLSLYYVLLISNF
jgi:hypothetical protein